MFALACAPGPPPETPPPPRHPGEVEPLLLPAGPLVMATAERAAPPQTGAECALRLGRAPRAGCGLLFPLATSASGASATAGLASDGSTCTIWNAGGHAPHSVTLDLGAPTRVDVIALVPEMTPNGQVSHEIAFSDDGRTFQVGHRLQAPMQSGVAVELVLPSPERARFVRVSTSASPSWVAWREIGLFRCGGE